RRRPDGSALRERARVALTSGGLSPAAPAVGASPRPRSAGVHRVPGAPYVAAGIGAHQPARLQRGRLPLVEDPPRNRGPRYHKRVIDHVIEADRAYRGRPLT